MGIPQGWESDPKSFDKFSFLFSKSLKHASSFMGDDFPIEQEMRINGSINIQKEHFKFQSTFSYTIIVDSEKISIKEGTSGQMRREDAFQQILKVEIIDPGMGELTITAEENEQETEIKLLNFVFSVDEGKTWQRASMKFNGRFYVTHVQIESSRPLLWTMATKNLKVNGDKAVLNFWVKNPNIITKQGVPFIFLPEIIVGAAATTDLPFQKFRKEEVVGINKERVMRRANSLSDEEATAQIDDHSFGVVLSYFDQFEGPIPSIGVPRLLEENFQFLLDLSDRSFSATGFVEEKTEVKVAIFDISLDSTRMKCISYAFAIDVLEARGGKDNMTINFLINPSYVEIINNFSSELLPMVRWICSLIENKSPRENVATQIEGLRNLVSRIITAYQEIYGK